MKSSHVLVLGLILFFLGVGIAIKQLRRPAYLAASATTSLKADFDAAKVSKIVIGKGEKASSIELVKEKGWKISGAWKSAADNHKVDALLGRLKSLEGELRSTDKALLADYGIADEEAFHVHLLDGDKSLTHFLIGAKSSGAGSVFVRLKDSAEVFAVDEPLLESLGVESGPEAGEPPAEYWHDLRFFRSDTSLVREIQVLKMGPGEPVTQAGLVKQPAAAAKPEAWAFSKIGHAFALDEKKVQEYLQFLSGAMGIRAVDPKADYGFQAPLWKITVTLEGTDAAVIEIAAKPGQAEQYFIRNSLYPEEVFEIPFYTVERIAVKDAFFYLDNPFGIRSSEVKEVLLRRGGKEVFLSKTEDKKALFQKELRLLEDLDEKVAPVEKENVTPALFPEAPDSIEVRPTYGKAWVLEFGGPAAGREGSRALRVKRTETVFSVPDTFVSELFSAVEKAAEEAAPSPAASPAAAAASPAAPEPQPSASVPSA
ncbi:MAG TPA: DUF4340 domain-containing protein [Verrucomicrobiae bacterium]|nr:DUF4340 domain-containing protein [Verrucomicrobiae bacterium]